MESSLKYVIKLAVIIGVCIAVFSGIWYGLVVGVLSGVILGMIFGIIISFAGRTESKKFMTIKEELAETNAIIFDCGANNIVGRGLTVGGWLYLTEEKLIFVSGLKSLQERHMLEMAYSEISVVNKPSDLVSFFSNRLEILTRGNLTSKFVVAERNVCFAMISEKINKRGDKI